MRLEPGDRVATGAVVGGPPETLAPAQTTAEWPGGRVGLRDGESARICTVYGDVRKPEDIEASGPPAIGREEWAQTEVHAVSSYWCVHCGQQHPDPVAVYECIDRHVQEERDKDGVRRHSPQGR